MFYSKDNFPFLQVVFDNLDTIAKEFERASVELPQLAELLKAERPELYSHVYYWSKETGADDGTIGYDLRMGTFGAFPIFKEGFPIQWYNVDDYFPKTMEIVRSVPGVFFSVFSRLAPGSGTAPHTHKMPHLIFHVTLNDNEGGSYLVCGDKKIILEKKGDYAIFDYRKMHSSKNSGKSDRINFVIDFEFDSEKQPLIQHEKLLPAE